MSRFVGMTGIEYDKPSHIVAYGNTVETARQLAEKNIKKWWSDEPEKMMDMLYNLQVFHETSIEVEQHTQAYSLLESQIDSTE